jgi:hypothetical protein
MAFASHLGPWLLGTVKHTTGTAAGTIRNMGATSVGQMANVAFGDTATTQAFAIPAGAILTNVTIVQTTKFTGTSGVITLYNNGTAFAVTGSIGAGSQNNIAFNPSSDTQGALWANVGSTDAIITYTMASSGSLSAGAGVLLVEYIVRNSDGAANPTSQQA